MDSDRHRCPRVYLSGAEKRKRAKEKDEKEAAVMSKTRRITDFMAKSVATSEVHDVTDTVAENVSEHVIEAVEVQCTKDTIAQMEVMQYSDSTDSALKEKDIGLWPKNLSSSAVEFWIKKGVKDVQHCDETLLQQKSYVQNVDGCDRRCHVGMFERQNQNGEKVQRSWVCFSPSNGKLYCFVCKIMGATPSRFTDEGFCDWKHYGYRMSAHEKSQEHLQAVVALARRAKEQGRIDTELALQVGREATYWRKVLKRLVSVIRFCCERGLALRGENIDVGSPSNGNYLGLLELLAEYDDFLKQHIDRFRSCGSGHTNYLSPIVCEELVEVMGERVLAEIVSRIKKSKYYSLSMDSTTDEGHLDQLTLTFRYMEKGSPVERFVKLMGNQAHKAKDIVDGLMDFLQLYDIDIKDCRGQSSDNAATFSGRHSGVQAQVLALNPLALWQPCAAHSLNLVGVAAAKSCLGAVKFFDFLEELYVFFTDSTHRFQILTDVLKETESGKTYVPKRLIAIRWSCRADATKALVNGYSQIRDTLHKMAQDKGEPAEVRCKATGLHKRMLLLEIAIYALFWNDILQRTDATNKALQNPNVDINTAVASMQSLTRFVEYKREQYGDYEKRASEMTGTTEYKSGRKTFQNVRLIPLEYARAPAAQLSPSKTFQVECFNPVIDSYVSALKHRLSAYDNVSSLFGFLSNFAQIEHQGLKQAGDTLANAYPNDLESCLGDEMVQFQEFLKVFEGEKKVEESFAQFMYTLILQKNVQDEFPNLEIALRLYLVMMVTNCSAERSFSKMKIIKNRLRTSMLQDRLTNLTLMSIESDILRDIDFSDIIRDFSTSKSRRVPLVMNIS